MYYSINIGINVKTTYCVYCTVSVIISTQCKLIKICFKCSNFSITYHCF